MLRTRQHKLKNLGFSKCLSGPNDSKPQMQITILDEEYISLLRRFHLLHTTPRESPLSDGGRNRGGGVIYTRHSPRSQNPTVMDIIASDAWLTIRRPVQTKILTSRVEIKDRISVSTTERLLEKFRDILLAEPVFGAVPLPYSVVVSSKDD